MSVIIPQGTADIRFIYSTNGTNHISVTGHGVGKPDPIVNAADIAEEVADAWTAMGALGDPNYLCNGWKLERVDATVMLEDGPAVGSHNVNAAGLYIIDAVTINTCALVRKVTGGGGKRNRGRMYVPGGVYLPESEINIVGEISGPQQSFYTTRLNNYMNELSSRDITPLLFHSDGGLATVITDFVLEAKVATQRRRLR